VLTVLEGTLTEHTRQGTRALDGGAQHVFAPGYVHEVVNDTLRPAVSLHIYFPGLTEMPMHSAQSARSARSVHSAQSARPVQSAARCEGSSHDGSGPVDAVNA
jgi:hypothetical protein